MKTTLIRGKCATGEVTIDGEPFPIEESLEDPEPQPDGLCVDLCGKRSSPTGASRLQKYSPKNARQFRYLPNGMQGVPSMRPDDCRRISFPRSLFGQSGWGAGVIFLENKVHVEGNLQKR